MLHGQWRACNNGKDQRLRSTHSPEETDIDMLDQSTLPCTDSCTVHGQYTRSALQQTWLHDRIHAGQGRVPAHTPCAHGSQNGNCPARSEKAATTSRSRRRRAVRQLRRSCALD